MLHLVTCSTCQGICGCHNEAASVLSRIPSLGSPPRWRHTLCTHAQAHCILSMPVYPLLAGQAAPMKSEPALHGLLLT